MGKEVIIRDERPDDVEQVYRVISKAFGQKDEARLVERLRQVGNYVSLIAETDGLIIGHVSFTPVTLDNNETGFMGLAPMAILPEFQNRGIGSKLVREGLRILAEQGFTAVFVLGHSTYYPRFGFEAAKPNGFTCEYPSPEESFMVLELVPGSLAGKSGLIKYAPEFAEN